MVRLFNARDLSKIPRSTIVEYVLDGINILERDISLNELNRNIELSWETPERKIHINNLIKLLNILIEEGQNDPLAGKILLESEMLLNFLKKLKSTLEGIEDKSWLLGKEKSRYVLIARGVWFAVFVGGIFLLGELSNNIGVAISFFIASCISALVTSFTNYRLKI